MTNRLDLDNFNPNDFDDIPFEDDMEDFKEPEIAIRDTNR